MKKILTVLLGLSLFGCSSKANYHQIDGQSALDMMNNVTNYIIIDVLCLFEQWQLSNGSLRPFKIAGEIDSMLDGARLSGIGVLNFVGANYISTKNGYGGYSLVYKASHSEDDKKGFNNPADEERFLEDFKAGTNG